jgi:hypothetical protein
MAPSGVIWGVLLTLVGVPILVTGIVAQIRRARPGIHPMLVLGMGMIVVAVILFVTAPSSTGLLAGVWPLVRFLPWRNASRHRTPRDCGQCDAASELPVVVPVSYQR